MPAHCNTLGHTLCFYEKRRWSDLNLQPPTALTNDLSLVIWAIIVLNSIDLYRESEQRKC